MKKFLIGLMLFIPLAVLPACFVGHAMIPAYAEEEQAAAATVVIPEFEHGKITASTLKGAPGDIVTLIIESDALYALEGLTVNGVAIAKDDAGVYKFALAEGENLIGATFILDDADAQKVISIVNSVKSDWKNIFTLENVLLALSYLLDTGLGVALVAIVIKYKKTKTIDRADVIAAVNSAIPEEAKTIIKDLLEEKVLPVLAKTTTSVENVEEAMVSFVQAFLYSLDGTVESKEKIISILSNLKISDETTVNALKDWVSNELKSIAEANERNEQLLKELKANNAKAVAETIELAEPEKEEIKEDSGYDGTEI